jgi:hypothetical protein
MTAAFVGSVKTPRIVQVAETRSYKTDIDGQKDARATSSRERLACLHINFSAKSVCSS